MFLSPSTSTLVDALDVFSQHKLTRKKDLGILIELATHPGPEPGSPESQARLHPDTPERRGTMAGTAQAALGELSFAAKFVSRSYGIMKRIGPREAGYDALRRQVAEQLEKAELLERSLLEHAPGEVREHFAATYYARSQEALERHLELLYDLSWYKNWLIDHRTE